ncbi:MAG: DUF4139 domain-containing protein [Acidobacteriota bacterium]|nr:MAG: DUF4139 domain-containing protein [Acidobacteriota bacterium]
MERKKTATKMKRAAVTVGAAALVLFMVFHGTRPQAAAPEAGHVEGAEKTFRSTAEDRRETAITVYNVNMGLVREVRDVSLGRGVAALEFRDVASKIQPETVHIKSLSGKLSVLEQNYQYDLLSPQKLLEKYVGRKVKVFRWNEVTGRDEEREAEVLSTNDGTILRVGDEITFGYPGRISFPEIPGNLIAEPTLVWLLDSAAPKHKLEVSYLTDGMTWKADYVLVVDSEDAAGDLNGWVTLNNTSGAGYENARLKLVAGDVHRAEEEDVFRPGVKFMAAAAEPQFREEAFFEYHLYTLERPTTLRDNEQKQISLLEAPGVKIEKRLVFRGAPYYFRSACGRVQSNQKVGVFLDIENKKAHGLGMPLPKGIVRVYKADAEGSLQFIGEDRIDHTPRDERVRIKMGEAFDVVGDRVQTDYKDHGRCGSESEWEISLRNHKDEDAEVDVFEPAEGEWKILTTSHDWEKVDAHTFKFIVRVPSHDEVKIRYRVRIRWC